MSDKPYHHGNLKHALIHAAQVIIAREGMAALSLRRAAKQAGVSPAAPYRHFPNKSSLLAAIAAHAFEDFSELCQDAIRRYPRRPDRQLFQIAQAYIEWIIGNPHLKQIMFIAHPKDYPDLDRAHRATEDLIMNVIRDGQDRNYITPGDPDEIFLAAWSFMQGLSTILLEESCQDHIPTRPRPQWVRHMAELAWYGLAHSDIPRTTQHRVSRRKAL